MSAYFDSQQRSVPELLQHATETYQARGAMYGNSVDQYGAVMAALFPEGLVLCTTEGWARFGLLSMVVSKLTRYANNFTEGGHADSIHDLGVYAFMLQAQDQS